MQLKKFIEKELKYLRQERVNYKSDEGEKKALEIPAMNDWYKTLKGDTKKSAKRLFGRINAIAADEEHRRTLYKHGVLAFEHLVYKDKLQQLDDINIENLEKTVELFSELDDIEATWYYQITKGRLEVINSLAKKINSNCLEKIIQKYIYEHLWLLDPSWERATRTA